jgi:methylenetetrahydrofolate dehydrogenase (NADP+)/methenyltetrahydrofolate cyclohydrolase
MTDISQSKLMDGRAPAKRLRQAAAEKIRRIIATTGVTPSLATVLVGDDPSSAVYVRMKRKTCEAVGIRSVVVEMPHTSATEQVVAEVERLAADKTVHAILVQHPVPAPIDRRAVFEAIPIAKDVDAVSSAALGRVLLGLPGHVCCTPAGIMLLLAEYHVPLKGMNAVVIGRSPILGRPMASMLVNAHATVTLCHSHTRDLPAIVRSADLIIAAVGQPRFVGGDWVKSGAVVVDAGYNEGNVGDVDFEPALARASLITPVPGGVGPMTLAVLIDNTANAAAGQSGCSTTG